MIRPRASRHAPPRAHALWPGLLVLTSGLVVVHGSGCSSSSGDGGDGSMITSNGTASSNNTSSSNSTSSSSSSGTAANVSTTTSTTGFGGTSTTTGMSSSAGGTGSGVDTSTTAAGGTGGGSSWEGCDEFVPPSDCTIPEGAVLPGELRCTGLYSNWETRTLRCGVQAYAPAYELWSDGAAKQRYVWLPPGSSIDVSDPDDWDYPVGTRFWKEFHVGPEGAQKLGETRYLVRTEAGWLYTAYVWDEATTLANQVNDGVDDLFGTGHSVPSREQCKTCHNGRDEFILGWDFIMLGPGATGVTAQDLALAGQLSELDSAHLDVTVPGDEIERAALTYLHANCGVSCH
ncbi:MAG TPA: hypothetical protein VFU02_06270, partial [Polyangiaceae bacterium]|nr:hypothetical protein [Polyangiaceae bacterium]